MRARGTGTIIARKRGNKKYYYYSRSYRVKIDPNATGKVKGSGKSKVVTQQVYLGTAEDILKLIEEAKKHQEPKKASSRQFGLPMALFEMAERIGLRDIINKVVPGKICGISPGDFILIAAINRVGNHHSKAKIGRWYNTVSLKRFQKIKAKKLSSKSFWRVFDKIVNEQAIKEEKVRRGYEPNEKLDIDELSEIIDDSRIKEIEKLIWESLIKKFQLILDVVLYDTTNFYTYYSSSTGNSLAQYGKSKEKRDNKRLVGLQLAILKDLGIPIFHTVYSGNIHDVSLMPTAINRLTERYQEVGGKTEKLVLIFDKGNNSSGNIEHIEKLGMGFVGSLVPSHHRDLLHIPVEDFTEISGGIRAYRTSKHVFGSQKTIVITYNEKRARGDEHIFERQLRETVKEAKKFFETVADEPTEIAHAKIVTFLRMKKIGTSQALRFFSIKVWHNGWVNKFQIRRKKTEVFYKKASFGKTILFTNLNKKSTEYIVSQYRSAHKIENTFHHLKDRDLVSYYPAYHWTDSKIRVHAFVCVLALLLIKLLCFIANLEGLDLSTTLLIEELQDIHEVILIYPNRRAVRTISHMSTVQKKLFHIYGLDKYT